MPNVGWEAVTSPSGVIHINDLSKPKPDCLVCGIPGHSRDKAPLIAAAPELLEALEKALQVMTSQRTRLEDQADAITAVRAAIAKAEGQ